MDKARQLAAKDAKTKAQKLAQVFNFSVGRILKIDESSYALPVGP